MIYPQQHTTTAPTANGHHFLLESDVVNGVGNNHQYESLATNNHDYEEIASNHALEGIKSSFHVNKMII